MNHPSESDPAASKFVTRYPPGHFYSPLPDMEEVIRRRAELFGHLPESLPGIDLRVNEQRDLIRKMTSSGFECMAPYELDPIEGYRFYHRNNFYSGYDALILHGLMRVLQPRRIIEAGSGFSSAMMLDTNERHFNNQIEISFIEPYPQRLKKLLNKRDRERIDIREEDLQKIDLSIFAELGENDILFIDSTHVSKIGSDVNYILFHILPALKPGVFIHVHDIFYPFEYQEHWLMEGRAWNEAYMLRAFLQYNVAFPIRLFTSYLLRCCEDVFEGEPWSTLPGRGAWSSIWLEKVL